jgi:putative FmdB family regulatory protein
MKCESHFEELVRGDEQVACPDCAATNVSRQFSSFAVHGLTKSAKAGSFAGRAGEARPEGRLAGGGGCCGGSCGCGH